jgi:hypothetical protein
VSGCRRLFSPSSSPTLCSLTLFLRGRHAPRSCANALNWLPALATPEQRHSPDCQACAQDPDDSAT